MQKTLSENSVGQIIYRVVAGILFGFANVIPGVSGGTVMVVLGLYERIIGIITDFFKKIKTEWKFFLPIVIGMGIAILLFGKVMSGLLSRHADVTQMFFIGIIIFSIPGIFRRAAYNEKKKLDIKPLHVVIFLLVLALMVFMFLSDASAQKEAIKNAEDASAEYTADHSAFRLVMLVVYGAIACSTMIIPGISGSLVMVMLGQYKAVIDAVAHFDIVTLLPFGVGCVLGLVFVAKLIRWLMKNHSQATYSAILGFVIGSILPVFPGFPAAQAAPLIAFVIGGAVITFFELIGEKQNKA
ncbi:MAG: DUF368 domain-containing protein [Clostridia bacterium]|nr:DUF368 domain-containing protein [Clostridia bacterium]